MKKMIICNHKMFLNRSDALILKNNMESIDLSNINLIVCPSFINFDLFKGFNLCAQDCFYEDKGPYTGEISCYNLKEIGINYSLIGHSYRRKYDTNEIINLKIKSLLKNNMVPILCIGETKNEHDFGITKEVLNRQIKEALKDICLNNNEEIIIAYEPVWTIGSGFILTKDKLNDVIRIIKDILSDINIRNYKLIYGGSVNSESIKDIIDCNLDGYLLGGSSIDFEELKKIIDCTKMCK